MGDLWGGFKPFPCSSYALGWYLGRNKGLEYSELFQVPKPQGYFRKSRLAVGNRKIRTCKIEQSQVHDWNVTESEKFNHILEN